MARERKLRIPRAADARIQSQAAAARADDREYRRSMKSVEKLIRRALKKGAKRVMVADSWTKECVPPAKQHEDVLDDLRGLGYIVTIKAFGGGAYRETWVSWERP